MRKKGVGKMRNMERAKEEEHEEEGAEDLKEKKHGGVGRGDGMLKK